MTGSIPVTRRERVRVAAFDEIKQTARRLLVRNGTASVSMRAIARDMGMTAPALYRYYPSLRHLVDVLRADLFDELRGYVEAAVETHPDHDPITHLVDASRAFRRWSVEHPAEFSLIFTNAPRDQRPEGFDATREPHAAAVRLAAVFLTLFRNVWTTAPFPVEPDHAIDPALRVQLERYRVISGFDAPPAAVKTFLSCWIRVYGAVALEVFGHLRFALTSPEQMFEAEIAAAAESIRQVVVPGPAPAPVTDA